MTTVHWNRTARNALASAWNNADAAGRREISNAAREIDRRLQGDPEQEGESRPNGCRVLFVRPLAALYRVVPQPSAVRVLSVWRY